MNYHKNKALFLFTSIVAFLSAYSDLPGQKNGKIHFQNFDGFTNKEYADYLADEGWPADFINTAAEAEYLTEDEKNVVLTMNLIRFDPAKYAEFYVYPIIQYFDGKLLRLPGRTPLRTVEGSDAVKELYLELLETQSRDLFYPSQGMSKAANDHARYMKRTGKASHEGRGDMNTRISKYGQWDGGISENLHWGASNAHDAVLSLMTDDGIKNRGHRKIILDPDYTYVGVAIDKHPRYNISYVIKYAVMFTEKQ
ncbi:MAG: CAP domain-containing protein [Bacteroidales bacterium]